MCKLGYGGTQSEMIRLINDSGILQEKIENLDGITFDQVVEAIHKVQTNMGITGTTAKEAASTIQGSIGMMKGAWENFMIAMADPNQDIDAAMNNLVDSVVTVADNLVPRIVAILPRLVEGVTHLCQTLAGYLPGIIEQLFPALVSGILALISKITEILPTVIQLLLSFLPVFIDGVMQLTMGIIEVLPEVIQMVVDALIECLPQLIQGLVQLTIALVAALPEIIMVLINAIPQIIGAIIEGFAPLAGKMKEVAVKVMTGVKDVFTKIWNAIKSTMTNVLNAMKSTVSNIFNSIKSSISNAMNAVKSTVSSILDAVKSKFSSIFNGIKSFLSPVVDWLKNIFHFHWELPKIKLPHFSISGKFSLNPPSIPHFNVSWYKKAMEDGMIMNQPTVFGFNARNNSLMAGGEAGSETVVGTNSLMTMIKTAVATENQELLARVDRLIAILMQFFPQILGGLDRDIILDSGVLVGSLAPGMDTELGSIYKKRKRGVLG